MELAVHRPDSKGWLRTVFSIMLALCILWGAVGTAFAAIPQPAPEFYVLDQARILKAETRSYIIDISSRLAEKTGAQVAVVTLNSLEDQPLEDVSLGILREWGLGDKEQNNGVLILVVPAERKSRIEVGYGLEGALPDGKTGRIQDEPVPAFRKVAIAGYSGLSAVISEIEQEYGIVVGEPASPGTISAGESLPPWAVALMALAPSYPVAGSTFSWRLHNRYALQHASTWKRRRGLQRWRLPRWRRLRWRWRQQPWLVNRRQKNCTKGLDLQHCQHMVYGQ